MMVVRRVEKKTSFALEALDIKYKLTRMKQPLSLEPIPQGLQVIGSNLYVMCSKGVEVYPFQCKATSLSSVIGKGILKSKVSQDPFALRVEDLIRNIDSLSVSQLMKELEDIKLGFGPQIPEKLLAKAMASLVKRGPVDDMDMKEKEEQAQLLVTLVAYPFNPSFMTTQMRALELQLSQCLSLIQQLTNMLTLVVPKDMDINNNLIDWICVVIDANFKQIVVSRKESAATLNNLMKVTENCCEIFEALESVRNLVEVLNRDIYDKPRNELSSPQLSVGKYRIETLYL
jgi:hypothetical protein